MNSAAIPTTGEEHAKKKPPKLIEKVIDKVEEALTKPAGSEPVSVGDVKPKQPSQRPPQHMHNTEQTQAQGSQSGSSEYVLPKGTTIKLPDGNEFETHTKSKISKEEGSEV